jgi:hypothetical protein
MAQDYGYVGTLAAMVPELKGKLAQAKAANWDVARFTKEIQDTTWWKNSADALKKYQILQATKPGEFKQQRDQLVGHVRRLAGQLGVGLTEGNTGTLSHIVRSAMTFGWDDETLRAEIGNMYRLNRGKAPGGDAGATTQKLRQLYADYGIPLSEDLAAKATRAILSGTATVDSYTAQAINSARSRYAALAPQLDQGMTVRDIADPYMQMVASTLEIPPGKVSLTDARVQKALTARDDKGQPTTQPLWSFERDLKSSPQWDKTKQAANAAYDVVNKIGQQWGFLA